MTQLDEKCRKEEAKAKAQAACDAMELAKQQKTGGEERKGQKPPSPGAEAQTEEPKEKGGADQQMAST